MDANNVEQRVRLLIDGSSENQEQFAERIALDPTKLSKALNGRRRFTSFELASIASAAEVSVDWILNGTDDSRAVAARVAHTGTSVKVAIEQAEGLAEARSNLAFLGIPRRGEAPEAPVLTAGLWIEQGAKLAEFALKYLGMPDVIQGPESFASAIERTFGIDVRVADLGEGCDGLALCTADARILLVSTSGNPTRQRFTMAHELAHLLERDGQPLHVDEDVMARSSKRDASELRANAFAASLLMPETLLSERVSVEPIDANRFSSLVMELMVSPSALAWRLLNLKLISDDQRREFGGLRTLDCASKVGRMKEYATWVEESTQERVPVQILQDTLSAYLDKKSTLRPLARLVGVSVDLLQRAIDNPVLPAAQGADEFAP